LVVLVVPAAQSFVLFAPDCPAAKPTVDCSSIKPAAAARIRTFIGQPFRWCFRSNVARGAVFRGRRRGRHDIFQGCRVLSAGRLASTAVAV
jgi:hypothetical protein